MRNPLRRRWALQPYNKVLNHRIEPYEMAGLQPRKYWRYKHVLLDMRYRNTRHSDLIRYEVERLP